MHHSAKGAMKTRRPNPNLVKIHRSYTVEEVAKLFGKHKNTVREWIKQGLAVSDNKRPTLILGAELFTFLQKRRNKNKQPCQPGEMFCFRCRAPRKPDADLIEFKPDTEKVGNLAAICPTCTTLMNKRVSIAKLPAIYAQMSIALPLALKRIGESNQPSVNSDFK